MNLNGLTIEFQDYATVKVTQKNHGLADSKYIAMEDFMKAIEASRKEDSQVSKTFSTPILPNTPDGKITTLGYEEYSNDQFSIILKREKGNIDFQYFDQTFPSVGHPRLLFKVQVADNTVVTTYVVAVKDTVITDETEIYEYPFSNVFHRGRVCWGQTKLPRFDSTAYLKSLPDIFLSSPCNNDNYGHNLSGLEYRPLLEELSGKDFKEEYLKPMNINYGQWLK